VGVDAEDVGPNADESCWFRHSKMLTPIMDNSGLGRHAEAPLLEGRPALPCAACRRTVLKESRFAAQGRGTRWR
jgi:hypothetical protein